MKKIHENLFKCTDIPENIFTNKIKQYGASFRVMRPLSISEQIRYKLLQLRNMEVIGNSVDDISDIVCSVFNYSIMGMIQMIEGAVDIPCNDIDKQLLNYSNNVKMITSTIEMKDSGSNYGSAWVDMSVTTFTDICITKTNRLIYMLRDASCHDNDTIKDCFIDICAYMLFYIYKMNNNNM